MDDKQKLVGLLGAGVAVLVIVFVSIFVAGVWTIWQWLAFN